MEVVLFMKDINWAVIGVGVIANEMANALIKDNRNIYSVANRTQKKAIDFANKYNIKKVYDYKNQHIIHMHHEAFLMHQWMAGFISGIHI